MPQRVDKTDFEVVLKDPYALSFTSQMDIVSDALPEIVTNSVTKRLFSAESDTAKVSLIDDLKKPEPVSLKLLASIYQYGNPAFEERAIGRY